MSARLPRPVRDAGGECPLTSVSSRTGFSPFFGRPTEPAEPRRGRQSRPYNRMIGSVSTRLGRTSKPGKRAAMTPANSSTANRSLA